MAAVDPTSDPIPASHSKTELEPSAPAILPAKLSDDIATIVDAEAGASLSEFVASTSDSNTKSKSRADSTDSTGTLSSESEDIAFAGDAEAGVLLTEIMPKRES